MDKLPIKRALLSVTDKSGLIEFAGFLHEHNVEIISTGGTANMLTGAGLQVTQVEKVTGFPEILGGRVKTLHPFIHAGVLADKDNPEHMKTLEQMGIKPFDLICVNLYNFARAVADDLDIASAVEEIDIGGPTLLRAAAKNFHSIAVVPDPDFYTRITDELRENHMRIGLGLRRQTALHVFRQTSQYDGMIKDFLQEKTEK